jgi:hypothetical protein
MRSWIELELLPAPLLQVRRSEPMILCCNLHDNETPYVVSKEEIKSLAGAPSDGARSTAIGGQPFAERRAPPRVRCAHGDGYPEAVGFAKQNATTLHAAAARIAVIAVRITPTIKAAIPQTSL